MNYGKLTAGTTKTAIDTAKPSEKGEIITYLSRMGDVLDYVTKWGKLILPHMAIHAIIDSNKMDIHVREHNFCVHSHLQIITPKS